MVEFDLFDAIAEARVRFRPRPSGPLVPEAPEAATDVELDAITEAAPPERAVPAAEQFVPGVTLDLVRMRAERERIIASEIAAGRMADWPDSFRGFPLGVEGRDWFW